MKLYIADDNIEFADFCAEVATDAGWQVKTCYSGAELLVALEVETTPALVLCDIRMPEIDGIDVIKKLSDPGKLFRLRFITGGPITSALTARLIGDAREIEVGRFLVKPVSLAEMKSVLADEAEALIKMARLRTH